MLTLERFALQRLYVACAVGMLACAPTAGALELGAATIRSALGQPLLVEVPYRLAAGEQLAPTCVGLAPAPRPDRALPTYSRVSRIAITPTHIQIFGDTRVLEPLIGLTVDVHCESAPHFLRSYELFVDLPARVDSGTQLAAIGAGPAIDAAAPSVNRRPAAIADLPNGVTTAAATSESPATREAPRANVSARARGQTGEAVTQGQSYLVVRGDTLSGIAARVRDRQATIRETAEAIFAANPGAFTRGNRDLIEAGRSIAIPTVTAATAVLPAGAAVTPPPGVREPEPAAATRLASPEVPPAPTSETLLPSAQDAVTTIAREVVLPRAAAVTAVQPSAAPVAEPADAPEDTSAATTGRSSAWLTALLALGVVIALSTPLLLLRRREQEPAMQAGAKLRAAQPRRLIDPVAGIDVVEGQLTEAPSRSTEVLAAPNRTEAAAAPVTVARPHDSLALSIGPTDAVDLDVGVPIEDAATVRMPEMDRAATARQQPVEPGTDVSDPTIADEQHTLTIVELDMLRQDYEVEHTLTQAANKELRDAVADLKATQAARAASADTATLEMPQQRQTEATETQRTQKLRSSR
jgi:phage tail protein X